MDAAGYLKKHGWRGTGHSLDDTNKGLRRPLLVSKKIDVLGVGINKHDVIADQWWMKAFDSSLKDFGTGKKGLLGNVKEHGVRRGGLYARFVQGEGVPGTIGKEMLVGGEGGEDVALVKKKRKVEDGDGDLRKRAKKSKKTSSSEERKQRSKKDAKDTPGSDSTSADKKRKREKTLEQLPPSKRQQYADRAAEKGLSIEQYFAQRQLKNLEASNARHQPTTTTTTTTSATAASTPNPSVSEDPATSATEKPRTKKSDKKEKTRRPAPEQSETEPSASKSKQKDKKRKRKDKETES